MVYTVSEDRTVALEGENNISETGGPCLLLKNTFKGDPREGFMTRLSCNTVSGCFLCARHSLSIRPWANQTEATVDEERVSGPIKYLNNPTVHPTDHRPNLVTVCQRLLP